MFYSHYLDIKFPWALYFEQFFLFDAFYLIIVKNVHI